MKRTITEAERHYLLTLARQSVGQVLGKTAVARKPDLDRELDYDAACFVTLTKDGELRGCIGSLQASRNIVDDVLQTARSAAFHDPRFPPVTGSELSSVKFEISVLTEPEAVEFDSEGQLFTQVRPGIDGVIIEYQGQHATFLPQVWQQLPDHESFFAHLMRKAGIDTRVPLLSLNVQRYQVVEFHD